MANCQKSNTVYKAYRKLGINISLFAISAFGSKILQFLLMPLYTNCLSTAEYGTVDLLGAIVQLLIPVFTLDIADAVLRFSLDDTEDKKTVFNIAIQIIIYGSTLLVIILLCANFFLKIEFSTVYLTFIFLSFLFSSIYSSISYFFRGLEKIKAVVVAGLLSTLVNLIFNIFFLLIFKWGLIGYLIANLLGTIIPTLYLIIYACYDKSITFFCLNNDKNLKIKMIKYSTPLIVNAISWWINNSLDKLIVTSFLGVEANGLLAVAYKIPSILAIFVTIFNQAWTMSVVQEFDSEDNNNFLSRTYSLYNCGMTIVCSVVLILNIPLARVLYAKEFFVAWKYTGFLIVSYLFNALSICVSGVFSAVKDSKSVAISTMIGACVNTVFNVVLINSVGIQGATIATLISNTIVWIYRMYKVREYVKLKIRVIKDVISYVLILIQCVMGLGEKHCYIGQIICFALIIILYIEEIKLFNIKSIISKKQSKNDN